MLLLHNRIANLIFFNLLNFWMLNFREMKSETNTNERKFLTSSAYKRSEANGGVFIDGL